MNTTTLTKKFSTSLAKKTAAVIVASFLFGALISPALAQTATTTPGVNPAAGNGGTGTVNGGTLNLNNLVTNANGVQVQDQNPNTAYMTRQNYFKRWPFAQAAFNADKLVPVTSGNVTTPIVPGGGKPGGTGTGPRNTVEKGGSGRDAATQATNTNTSGSNVPTTHTGKESLLKSQLLTQPVTIPVYNAMVVGSGQPTGHFLPGSTALDQPQFVSPLDAIPSYTQGTLVASDKPKTYRDLELFQNLLTTYGIPVSDTQYQLIERENNQRMLELAFDPERIMWESTNQMQTSGASGSNALAGSAENALSSAFTRIISADGNSTGNGGGGGATPPPQAAGGQFDAGALINIANEQSGVPTASDNPNKTIPQAVWMVQQMYKYVFVPLAILFLLPGAVATQVKCQIVYGFKLNAKDQSSPFEGILRSVIAIFLIPATQLIVSYSIDVGNSMAYSVKDWVNINLIIDWAFNLTYDVPLNNVNNAIIPPGNSANAAGGGGGGTTTTPQSALGGLFGSIPGLSSLTSLFGSATGLVTNGSGSGGDGLGAQVPESQTINENQLWLSQVMEVVFNMANYIFSSMIIVLSAYQLTFMCYLYLLGPLSAAFFAWPRLENSNSSQNLFTDVWANWCNAVIVVSLWRFYWMVILAIMTQRILYIEQSGGSTNLQWEVAVFTCLMGLMLYVPFNPWSFDPAAAFTTAAAAGAQMMQGASQAIGAAAQAAGVPASQVQAAQAQINQAIAPLAQMGGMWNNLQLGGDINSADPTQSIGGAGAGTGAGSGTGGGTPGAINYLAAANPPSATGTAGAAVSPQSETTSAPPTSTPAATNPAVATVAAANPNAEVSPMTSPTVPLTPTTSGGGGGGGGGGGSGYSLAVNPSISSPEAGTAMASLDATHIQPLSLDTGGGGGGPTGGNPPVSTGSEGTPGTSNDTGIAAGALGVANSGSSKSNSGANSTPPAPAETPPPATGSPNSEPPPTEYA